MAAILEALGISSPQASRLFIDLIRDVTSKWANWDPALPIQVGDFGTVNKETGELEVKGNIYSPRTMEEIFQGEDAGIRELVEKNHALLSPHEADFYAVSLNGRKTELETGPTTSIPGIADASIKGRWTFNSRRGAFLLMAHPRSSYIPPDVILEKLAKVKALKGMTLVTQVFSCSAYSLYLSNEKNDDVSVALIGSTTIPNVSGTSEAVGGQTQARWWSSTAAGLFRNGIQPHEDGHYAPLYTLKKIRGKVRSRRGLPDPVFTGDELWADVEPPWDLLDENGNIEPTGSDEVEES